MYEIKFSSKRLRKKFEEIVNLLKDEKGYCELEYALQNYPKGNPTTHDKISRKLEYWAYKLSWGDRVTYKAYDDIDNKKIVVVYFIGNHRDYETFLRKYGKKKN